MSSDGPIVDEVRRRRGEISERFGDDLERYGQHIRELQRQYRDRLVSQVTVVPAAQVEPSGAKADRGLAQE